MPRACSWLPGAQPDERDVSLKQILGDRLRRHTKSSEIVVVSPLGSQEWEYNQAGTDTHSSRIAADEVEGREGRRARS
jgi:hypothetical protein